VNAAVRRIALTKRVICVSDIHGHVHWLNRLLENAGYAPRRDTLLILGDIYTKGPYGAETLRRVMELSRAPNVHILRGNCEDITGWMSPDEDAWVNALPHILDAGEYVFVHGGLPSEDLEHLEMWACMKNDAFMEQGLSFSRWVVHGHWPVNNYCHRIPCYNPIVSERQRIIAIDGGCGIKGAGQLNAFLIEDGAFSFMPVDDLPLYRAEKTQCESGGTLNTTWSDRFVDVLSRGDEFSIVRHRATGLELETPNSHIWEHDGQWQSAGDTDYCLPVAAGETVKLVEAFSDRVLAKKDGVAGWIFL
jgi:protein phosphatase